MVPARNLLRRHYDTYGGTSWFDDNYPQQKHSLILTNPMAEEPSRRDEEDEAEEAGEVGTSTSKDTTDDDWLQLGIGQASISSTSSLSIHHTTNTTSRQTELDLFSNRPSSSLSFSRPPPPPPPPPPHMLPMYRRDVPWGFWNQTTMMGASSSLEPSPPLQYSFRRFGCLPGTSGAEMRVVSPPRRPQAGVWFMLQAGLNQVREPFLPQIPRTYLRIKDGRMTVKFLMKYLVRKLGLEDESEVEITCRGQPLLPFLTLQHVRDNIWCLRAAVEMPPDLSAAADHVMVLHYARSGT